jgi:Xaa-Pro aminopeptidase
MEKKISHIQELLSKKSMDVVMLSESFSVLSFTGFFSSNALLFIFPKHTFFFTDARYLLAAKEYFQETNIEVRNIVEQKNWKEFFQKQGGKKIGIEMDLVRVSQLERWKEDFFSSFVDVSSEIKRIRSQKTQEEIRKGKKAAGIADMALQKVIKSLTQGVSEKEFSWELEKCGRELGAEKVSFDPVVAFGRNSAVPHHRADETKLKRNQPILIDWGFIVDGFCSDCTRCFFYGIPSSEWVETYKKVLESQKKGIQRIASGKSIASVQEVADSVLPQKIPHSFGHGVGREVHEYPTISQKTTETFLQNMIVTAEPGIYFSEKFGIRIEDMGVVTDKGFESFTLFPKTLELALL